MALHTGWEQSRLNEARDLLAAAFDLCCRCEPEEVAPVLLARKIAAGSWRPGLKLLAEQEAFYHTARGLGGAARLLLP